MGIYPVEITYLIASVLFVMGLRGMSHPESARRGMFSAALGMLAAIIGTLLVKEIVSYEWIFAGLVVGSLIGSAMSIWMPMTAMPQRTALSHAFGALAAALVGIAEYSIHGAELGRFKIGALGFEVMLGSLTFTGSMMAFSKLQGLIRGTPITYKGQNFVTMILLAITLGSFGYLFFDLSAAVAFYTMVTIAFVFGVVS